jgi:hypothetical protein
MKLINFDSCRHPASDGVQIREGTLSEDLDATRSIHAA